jgi:membrane fusion protein (multidrug efflux system)
MLTILTFLMASCTQKTVATDPLDAVSAPTDYTQLVSSAVTIELGALRPSVVAGGVVQGIEELVVRTQTTGTIVSVDFDIGMHVEQGQPLITLDDSVAKLSLSQLERQVENARATWQVDEQLFERGAISASARNQSRSTLDGLLVQLERAQDTLGNTIITAPISGKIADTGTTYVVGDTVQPGQTVARIIDLSRVQVSVALGQSQIFSVKEGAPATLTVQTPLKLISAEGFVQAVSAGSDARTGSWTVKTEFENPDEDLMRSGLSAQVTIMNEQAPEYPLIPQAALVNREGKTYIYILRDTSADLVEVTIIDRYGDITAVQPVDDTIELIGESVLTSGLSRIKEDTSVVTQYE